MRLSDKPKPYALELLDDRLQLRTRRLEADEVDSTLEMLLVDLVKYELEEIDKEHIRRYLEEPGEQPLVIAVGMSSATGSETVFPFAIKILKRAMEATIRFSSRKKDVPVSLDDLRRALHHKGIVNGVDWELLEDLVRVPTYDRHIVFARGRASVNGKPAEINRLIEPRKDYRPAVDRNGKADFKTVETIVTVEKDQLLEKRIPPTLGEDGMNVRGDVVKASPGGDRNFKKGRNTYVTENGLELRALLHGHVYVKDGKLNVDNCYVCMDVDYTVGNIDYEGDVVVRGSVLSGFKVQARGNVIINGYVEGGHIGSTTGGINVRSGVKGQEKSLFRCRGNLYSPFIENCPEIFVAGDLHVAGLLESCEVKVAGSIFVTGDEGQINNGTYRFGERVEVLELGSRAYTPTILKGDGAEQRHIRELIDKLQEAIDKLNKRRANPQMKENIRNLAVKQNELKLKLQRSYEKMSVKVLGNVFPGVTIRIGDAEHEVRQEMHWVEFRLKGWEVGPEAIKR